VRLFRRGRQATTVTAPPGGPAGDEDDDLFDGLTDDQPQGPGAGGGPVLLTLTTREQIEKAAAAEAEPKIIRVRPGRGAFGGTAGGHGCAHH
jgi:hypothetical protein